jgi:hypothetical protein
MVYTPLYLFLVYHGKTFLWILFSVYLELRGGEIQYLLWLIALAKWLILFLVIRAMMLIAQSTIKPLHSYFPPHLQSTTSAHPGYKQCCPESGRCYEVIVTMLLVLGLRNSQSTACEVWCLRFHD